MADLVAEFLSLFHDNQLLPDKRVAEHFGARYTLLPPVINELCKQNQILYFADANNLEYKLVKPDIATKLNGLSREQIIVYQLIDKAADKGIWKQDIRFQSNIPQQGLDKILKILEQRLLIKTVRSIGSKTKKLYMLFDTVPAKEITGGPWYTDQEFDYEFVNGLCTYIMQDIQSRKMVDATTLTEDLRQSHVSTVELSLEEVELVLQTLVYDGKIEEVQSTFQSTTTTSSTNKKMYKLVASPPNLNYFTQSPCGICPVIQQCCEGGVISPSSCQYMIDWLGLPDGSMDW